MPRKSKKEVVEEKVQEVVIEKPKRGRKKKVVPVPTQDPVEESVPAPVPTTKKRVRKKKVQETPVVVEEVKEEVKEQKPKKKPRALKVEKSSDAKQKRAPSKWVLHVQEFRKKNPNVSYKDALRKAKETYQK